ncbi:MAG: hypothetical protein VX475_11165 [Myxococcota bacterium]|nr:hypothetical protein [Myxococcota bacterium]
MQGNSYNFRVESLARVSPSRSGALGMLDILLQVMGARDHFDEYASLTSAGAKTYVHDWDVNLTDEAGEPIYHTLRSGYFSNYGVFESLGYSSGWDIKEFNFLKLSAVVPLLAYELLQGRAMLSMMEIEGELEPVALVGVDAGATWLKVMVQRIGSDVPEERDLWGQGSLQGEDEDFVNWCVVARPGERAEWAASRGKQRHDLIAWLCTHARSKKEFFHETRANYAPGLYGQRRFAELLELLGEDAFRAAQLERGIARYITAYMNQYIEGRAAFARSLSAWGDELGASEDEPWGDAARVKELFQQAMAHYEDAINEVKALTREDVSAGIFTPASIDRARAAVNHEEQAIEKLESALQID